MDSSVSAESRDIADTLAQSQNSQLKKGTGIDRSQKRTLLIWLLLGLLLPLVSMIPFLYLQGKRLIDLQSFFFFPLTTAIPCFRSATRQADDRSGQHAKNHFVHGKSSPI